MELGYFIQGKTSKEYLCLHVPVVHVNKHNQNMKHTYTQPSVNQALLPVFRTKKQAYEFIDLNFNSLHLETYTKDDDNMHLTFRSMASHSLYKNNEENAFVIKELDELTEHDMKGLILYSLIAIMCVDSVIYTTLKCRIDGYIIDPKKHLQDVFDSKKYIINQLNKLV